MELHYSNKELNDIEVRINRSIKHLEENGTILGNEHYLTVLKKLIEENKQLKDELLEYLQ